MRNARPKRLINILVLQLDQHGRDFENLFKLDHLFA